MATAITTTLNEIQQVYFGLKKDNITFIDGLNGNDSNTGLIRSFPKKTLKNYSTDYIYILNGNISPSEVLQNKTIIGKDNSCILNIATSLHSAILAGTCQCINLTVNCTFVYSNALGYYINFFNCILNINDSSLNGRNDKFVIKNCHIKGNSNMHQYFTRNNTISLVLNNTYNLYCVQLSDALSENKNNIDSSLIDSGDPSITDIDFSRSNIGITGGPYYFDGFKKNIVVPDNEVNVTIDTIDNLFSFTLNNVNIKSTLPNIANGIVQKVYKNNDTDITFLISKSINIETGQVSSTTTTLE